MNEKETKHKTALKELNALPLINMRHLLGLLTEKALILRGTPTEEEAGRCTKMVSTVNSYMGVIRNALACSKVTGTIPEEIGMFVGNGDKTKAAAPGQVKDSTSKH